MTSLDKMEEVTGPKIEEREEDRRVSPSETHPLIDYSKKNGGKSKIDHDKESKIDLRLQNLVGSETSRKIMTFWLEIIHNSERLLQKVTNTYNISAETSSFMTVLYGAYDCSKVESSRLSKMVLDLISEKYLQTISMTDAIPHTFQINDTSTITACASGIYNVSKIKSKIFFDTVARAYNNSHERHGSDSADSFLHMTPLYTVPVVLFLLLVLKWMGQKWRRRRHNAYFGADSTALGDLEGMMILRSTRDRSSTFDFFGTHLNQARERGNSSDDLSRSRSFSQDFEPPAIKRERMGSMDVFFTKSKVEKLKNRQQVKSLTSIESAPDPRLSPEIFVKSQLSSEDIDEDGFLYDEFGLVTLSFEIIYHGPTKRRITYPALTPPHAWADASRRIIPREINMRLKRDLSLDISESCIIVQEPTSQGQWDYKLSTKEISIHIAHPAAGGVLNLYTKGTQREDWNEFTFESTQRAAQFQLDLLSYQVLGKSLRNMFEVLSLVHRGSPAYDGQEFVLHQDRCVKEEKQKEDSDLPQHNYGCVAWDDAMRSLSSIPTIRIALERLWLSHRRPAHVFNKRKKQTAAEEVVDENGFISKEYTKKRMLLGPVDFFRLFVPALPGTAVPQTESNMLRMEQLLSWRKRAARASVLVQAYADSRRVVNLGWTLSREEGKKSEETLKKRLSFDDNEDNNRRDRRAKNEYYEASVSRDVFCLVRPFDFFSRNEPIAGESNYQQSLVLSPYQAYSLVGMHVFKIRIEKGDGEHPLNIRRDPVDVFPSLAEVISKNPSLDFLVMSFFNPLENNAYAFFYVRSLPKGIDPQFDNVIERFIEGPKELRDRKVHGMIQLAQRSSLSFQGWLFLRALTLYVGFTKGRGSPLGLEATKDRSSLPSMCLADYAETYHFGGALQKNPDLPKNYVSMTATYETKFLPCMISRFLFSLFRNRIYARTMDFTFVLEGEQDDELPERALCTTRVVHISSKAVAQSPSASNIKEKIVPVPSDEQQDTSGFRRWARHSLHHALALFSPQDNMDRNADGHSEYQDLHELSPRSLLFQNSDDPIEVKTNDVIDVLRGLETSVGKEIESSSISPKTTETAPVLSHFCRQDIQRFLLATEGSIKKACLRLVETATWRGQTFPIDKRQCRIELQSGQFFQQGLDKESNLVFYFRNICLGPWREDLDASLAAVISRLDESLQGNPFAEVTLIVLMGRPVDPEDSNEISEEYSNKESEEGDFLEEESDSIGDECLSNRSSSETINNPRISGIETWQLHTSKMLIQRLTKLLFTHYPGRLKRVLVVAGKGKNYYYSNGLKRRSVVKKMLRSRKIIGKVNFVESFQELTRYVERDQLISIVGGMAPIEPRVFEV